MIPGKTIIGGSSADALREIAADLWSSV